MKQKVMVMCLLASALLAVSCATLHRSMPTGVGIGIGGRSEELESGGEPSEASTVAAREAAHSEGTEAMTLNSNVLRYRIARSER